MKLRIAKKIYKRYVEWRDLYHGIFSFADAEVLGEFCSRNKRSSVRKAKSIMRRKAEK